MKTTFDGFSDTEIIPRTGAFLTTLANDPELYKFLLSLLPNPDTVKVLHDRFQVSFDASLTGGADKVAAKKSDRKALNRQLSAFASLIQLAALEDSSVTARAGLGLKQKVPAPTPPLVAPANFKVQHGSEHGTMFAKCSSVKTAKSLEMQVCQGDPTIDENWKFIGVYANCSKMEIKGLVPGTLYSFRVRGIRASGSGPWSSYVTLMAI